MKKSKPFIILLNERNNGDDPKKSLYLYQNQVHIYQ